MPPFPLLLLATEVFVNRIPLHSVPADPVSRVPAPLAYSNDPFDLLGIDRSYAGDMSAIKSAYKRLAKAYHPDATVTESMSEEHKRRINDYFSNINAAYEELMSRRAGFSASSASSEVDNHARPWHEGPGSCSAAKAGQYGYGQPMEAKFETSFNGRRVTDPGKGWDPFAWCEKVEKESKANSVTSKQWHKTSAVEDISSAPPKHHAGTSPVEATPSAPPKHNVGTSPVEVTPSAPPKHHAGTSPGFVGFREKDFVPPPQWQHKTGGVEDTPSAPPRGHEGASPGFVGFREKDFAQVRAPPTRNGVSHAGPGRSAAARHAARTETRTAVSVEERCMVLEVRLHRAKLVADAKRHEFKRLEDRLRRAEILADAKECEHQKLVDRLRRVELLAEAKEREHQKLKEELAATNVAHLQEKEQLEKRIQMLESKISQHAKRRSRPWYYQ